MSQKILVMKLETEVLQQETLSRVVLSQRFVMLLSMKLSAKEIPRMQPPPHVKAVPCSNSLWN